MWLTWREATRRALYGDHGFYLRERPSGHFRTSVAASSAFAEAVLRTLLDVDTALGAPPRLDFVDVGAGEGTLARHVLELAPASLRPRLHVTAVELAPPPRDLPAAVTWSPSLPGGVTGLVVANEWLDNVPVDVAEHTARGPRLVLVDPAGDERLGPPPEEVDLAWLARWWPLTRAGARAELGRPRDEAWAEVVAKLERGLAVAVDYAHRADDRPARGTLMGYRDGIAVPPVPDGSCDITAHVALDACAEAGRRAGATSTTLTTQREALRALGLTGTRPPLETAHSDPRAYLRALARASEEAELINPAGLGGFGWLAQWR
ncbi:SAM-dependent methyltransferase [Sinosporangium siamense]|uniref:SAM-dependent methyltransferase n=1 Tax=Sinosporangium siamense TaxID=1367973 RepID=UPI001EF19622|nr:SAM-dependent methyltransferase [Sinosporangium siamense]